MATRKRAQKPQPSASPELVEQGIAPLSMLKPAPYNPRKIDKAARRALRKSIETFGLVQPLVVNRRTMHVVGGHQRLEELKALGYTETPVVWVDLDDASEKALNVTLNSTFVSGEFDNDLLADLLKDLQAAPNIAFAELRLDDLLPSFDLGAGENDDDAPKPRTSRPLLADPGQAVVLVGDMREQLAAMPANSVDAIVTDPPYGLSAPPDIAKVMRHWLAGDEYAHGSSGFMGREWDSFVPGPDFWREAFRVLKPGGHAVVFAGTRTVDLMGIALRFAGFEVRDRIAWMFGTGFPKSLDVSKALDEHLGAQRQVIGRQAVPGAQMQAMSDVDGKAGGNRWSGERLAGDGTGEAQRWAGWGTALKPAMEPALLVRKPLESTVAANVLAHGVGGLDIDGCRVEGVPRTTHADGNLQGTSPHPMTWGDETADARNGAAGRWPANVILDEQAAAALDEQSGELTSGSGNKNTRRSTGEIFRAATESADGQVYAGDTGGASRFFLTVRSAAPCALCSLPYDEACAPATSADETSGPDTAALATARGRVRPAAALASEDRSAASVSSVEAAASPSRRSPETSRSSAASDASMTPVERIALAARSAATLCDSCATAFARALVEAQRNPSADSRRGLASMPERSARILSQHLASAAASLASIDITTTR